MHIVAKIHLYQATRNVELLNQSTGTKDLCFDDSALVSFTNFDFISEEKVYNCKIKLFGEFVEEKTDTSVEVTITSPSVSIGKKSMIEVKINQDIYYIPQEKAEKVNLHSTLFFDFTRKDLIQVNDVIHDDYL